MRAPFGGPQPPAGPGEESDDLDPELAALPRPSRQGRTLTVLVLLAAAAASVAMAAALRGEVAYALTSPAPTTLGDLRTTSAELLAASENHYVRAEGLLGAAGGIRYERLLVDDTFRTVPVAGRRDVWVDLRVPAGQDNGRWEPPATLTGRLVRFSAAGPRHRGLESAVEQSTHVPVPAGAWLLVDGDEPEGARWAIVLAGLFAACAVWNVVAIGRITRRVR
jgi:hypothetical protein